MEGNQGGLGVSCTVTRSVTSHRQLISTPHNVTSTRIHRVQIHKFLVIGPSVLRSWRGQPKWWLILTLSFFSESEKPGRRKLRNEPFTDLIKSLNSRVVLVDPSINFVVKDPKWLSIRQVIQTLPRDFKRIKRTRQDYLHQTLGVTVFVYRIQSRKVWHPPLDNYSVI